MPKENRIRSQLERFEKEIKQYAEALNLSRRTRTRAQDILVKAQQRGITGIKNPTQHVAAALYIACILEEERRTQQAISEVTQVSPSTIQHRYKELVQNLDIVRNK